MIHVILLAAGYSSRFGSNKLLHIVDGTPMYRHALEQTGNPVLFSAVYREELLGLRGDTGGKAIVRRHPNEVCLCQVSDPRALEDMDELQ